MKKAMILAAGLGSRFLPLSKHLPKPLLPLFNIPLIYRLLNWLKDNGVSEVMINLHHLGQAVYQQVGDGRAWGMRICYSWEESLLGSGGGLRKAADFFDDGVFLLVNSDIFVSAELEPILAFHRHKKATATMLLAAGDTKRYGAIGVNQEGRICQLPWYVQQQYAAKQGVFSGIHLLEPEIFDFLPYGAGCINRDAYPAMLAAGMRVYGYFLPPGSWYDLGEPDTYLASHWLLLDNERSLDSFVLQDGVWQVHPGSVPAGVELIPPVLVGRDCQISGSDSVFAPGSRIGPYVVIGDRVRIGERAIIERSVLLPGASIPAGERLKKVIWGQQAKLSVGEKENPAAA